MNFGLNDEHVLLRDLAQSFVDKETDLRALLRPGATAADAAYRSNWAAIRALGWPGMLVDEAFGGAGLSCIEMALVATEAGRTLYPSPLAGHLYGVWTVQAAASAAQREQWLPDAATGAVQFALVPPVDGNEVSLEHGLLHGSHPLVVDALSADWLMVTAREPGGAWVFCAVDARERGITRQLQPWRDVTRQVAKIEFDATPATRLPGTPQTHWPAIRDHIACHVAAENVGGIRAVLADAVRYANERVAFGRPIGAYQAIKHSLAEMLGQAECAHAALLYAAWALATGDARASLAAAMARSHSGDAYVQATHRSIQIFGAIGFTWEMNNHLYFKRARANAQLFGDARAYREHVINLATGREWADAFGLRHAG